MHDHAVAGASVSRKLIVASLATFIFVLTELSIGIFANSLSLIGDALHNFTDTLALLLALFAVRLERRPPNVVKSYGYHRAGVLAAFINAGTLAAFTLFIFIEAIARLRVPKPHGACGLLCCSSVRLPQLGVQRQMPLGDGTPGKGPRAAPGVFAHLPRRRRVAQHARRCILVRRDHRRIDSDPTDRHGVLGPGDVDGDRRSDLVEQLGRLP